MHHPVFPDGSRRECTSKLFTSLCGIVGLAALRGLFACLIRRPQQIHWRLDFPRNRVRPCSHGEPVVVQYLAADRHFVLQGSIEDYCEGGEYSRAGEWEADMRGSFGRDAGNGYNRGSSYANRGRHYVRGHYSRTDGRERMISDIEDMMQDATGAERDAYKRAADILRNA